MPDIASPSTSFARVPPTPAHDGEPGLDVLVVSGVRLYAEGLLRALSEDARFGTVMAAHTPTDALATVDAGPPDVLLLDLASLDDVDGGRRLVARWPAGRVVALAVRDSDAEIVSWAELGVAGLVTRHATLDELTAALVGAGRGQTICPPRVTAALLRRVAAVAPREPRHLLDSLTHREREISELLAAGLSNKEIAARLFLGHSTVKNHVHNVLAKAGASTRAEAVARLGGGTA